MSKPATRRARRARIRRIRKVVVALAVLGGLAGGGVALTRSSLFAVDGIQVAGVTTLSRDQILSSSGLRVGMNVLSVKTQTVEERLERLPLVADATVERIYPSKVKIVIRERVPAAAARLSGAWWLIEASGTMIAAVSAPPAGLPQVTVSAKPDSDALRAALRLWGGLPDWARQKTTELAAADPQEIVARIGGTKIVFGSADLVLPKMQAVVAIFERAKNDGRRVTRIDVRAPTRPAATFA